MPAHPSQIAPLRADALHNRERILRAAREAFATRGLEVPMAAIARRAGVGVATLYRRFPSRESLITEVFADQLAVCAAVVDEALADPDPWRAFRTVVEKVCSMQVADRGFTAAFLTEFSGSVDFEQARTCAEQGLAEIVRRAKAEGTLRADFDPADLILLLKANQGVSTDTGDAAAAASRRLVAYLLQSFRAESAGPLPSPPPFGLEHVYDLPPASP
ncbi:TetR/AcrR family transcriptional regulator [Nonomuraea purpurea]|uniref:TetR/AcrR family transcriptional regulator n=1 Tax=Nonomuraea purpurea TaxID=1849276 RepID=A0ABV8GPW3_9ACTN